MVQFSNFDCGVGSLEGLILWVCIHKTPNLNTQGMSMQKIRNSMVKN